MNPFNPFDAISARWHSDPIDFLITAAMPFVLLVFIAVFYDLFGARMPKAFYVAAPLATVLGLVYAPTCGCMEYEQRIGTAIIALLLSAIVFLPFILAMTLSKLTNGNR